MDKDLLLKQFKEYQNRMAAFRFAMFQIRWDASTIAPSKSAAYRNKMMGVLVGDNMAQQRDPKNLDMLEKVSQMEDIDPLDKISAEKFLKAIRKFEKVPREEMVARQQNTAMATRVWEEAKKKNDFAMFAPYLAKNIEHNKKSAEYRGYEGHPYNTLLDDYEEGMTIERYDAFFGLLKEELVPFAKKVHTEGRPIDDSDLYKFYPKAKQREFLDYLAGAVRYDLDRGLISESAHPFTSGASLNDVRVTARYLENYLPASIFLGLHEMGHAMHSQQGDPAHEGKNLGGAGMGIGESQSRFYENYIGRSRAFWQRHFYKLQNIFPEQLKNHDPDSFYRMANRSKPGLIRLDADELTYPSHIMVRYELEREIMSGDVDVNKLPTMWNDKIEEYLGVRPTTDTEGILQDTHWSGGSFGYFPTYALGTAYGAQFYYALLKDIDVEREIANDRMEVINAWLQEKIHRHGGLLTPDELMIGATGSSFDPKNYVRFLIEKYTEIYF
ncbi:MAG: carboxypeptidase M32 [Firmicutes bacterium]|jgi:carboxypeptidase Taq|nr:carboxypeptidase M32 [Bacillota bacterium]